MAPKAPTLMRVICILHQILSPDLENIYCYKGRKCGRGEKTRLLIHVAGCVSSLMQHSKSCSSEGSILCLPKSVAAEKRIVFSIRVCFCPQKGRQVQYQGYVSSMSPRPFTETFTICFPCVPVISKLLPSATCLASIHETCKVICPSQFRVRLTPTGTTNQTIKN